MNWIIGDVHGMYASLRRLMDAVHAADSSPVFTFAGDYVNRGFDSRKVIDLLLTLPGETNFVRGNHDDIFDLVINGKCFAEKAAGGTPAQALSWFMNYGLDRTLASYGLELDWLKQTVANPTPERFAQIAAAIPAEHHSFIRYLPVAVAGDQFFVVHGYWPPTEPVYPPTVGESPRMQNDARQQLIWGRFNLVELALEKPWGRRGFFGHTPVHTYFPNDKKPPMLPLTGPKIALIDTGCAIVTTGRMTAYCVEESRYIQSNAQGEMVAV